MVPKKRTSTGAVKSAFVAVKNVKDGQTVSVKGKVMRKSGILNFDCKKSYFYIQTSCSVHLHTSFPKFHVDMVVH